MEDVEALGAGCLLARMSLWRGQMTWKGCWMVCAQGVDRIVRAEMYIIGCDIASLQRNVEYDMKVAEMEWPDLMLFLKRRFDRNRRNAGSSCETRRGITPQPSVNLLLNARTL